MRNFILVIISMFLCNCGKEKIIQLPEINHSKISDIKDISAAYLFYDETEPDSVFLNRKNLISSTNWLINIDKRLTLEQVIPHISFLQKKKNNSSHKNKNSKNYFTCHDTALNNLGFVDFTDINYLQLSEFNYLNYNKRPLLIATITINNLSDIQLYLIEQGRVLSEFSHLILSDLPAKLQSINTEHRIETFVVLNTKLSFQDYILVKMKLLELDNAHFNISNNELIFN